ncbi:MAG TPA: diguanylate cyclase [Polyangiaceae bacterium]
MVPKLEKLLKSSPNLPSLPGVAVELLKECRRPEVDIDRVCDLLARDPALSAKVVGVANSPAYRRGSPVTTVKRASLALGTSAVTALALSFSLVSQRASRGSFDFAGYWRRGLLNAVAARCLAQQVRIDPEEAFLAGLLQDIGILALNAAVSGYDDIVREAKQDHLRLERLEREQVGAGHPEVGAWLATGWGLPEALVRAVMGSHVPLEGANASVLGKCVAVSGNVSAIWLKAGDKGATQEAAMSAKTWLGISSEAFQEVLTRMADAARGYAEAFEVALPSAKDMKSILSQAKDTLVQVSLRATQVATRSEADVQRLAAEKRTLEEQYARDALTGVYARGYLEATLGQAFDGAVQFDRALSVLFCDIDHFKKVNDTHGHAVGDKVLAAVARAVVASTRQLDVVGRYGGEEFVVILPATNASGALVVAERICHRVAALAVSSDKGVAVPVTISVGSATYDEQWRARDLAELLSSADGALYQAKRNGRNRVVLYVP